MPEDRRRADPDDHLYGTSGPLDARIMLVGESWGEQEARQKRPFVGATGELLEQLLLESKLPPKSECFITNVVPRKPQDNEMFRFFTPTGVAKGTHMPDVRGLYPQPFVMQGVANVLKCIDEVKPEIVVGFGAYALWALTQSSFSVGDKEGYKVPTGIVDWRGSQLYIDRPWGRVPFMPTIHPAAVFETWPWRYLIKHDLSVRVRERRNRWAPPRRELKIRPTASEAVEVLQRLRLRAIAAPLELAVDIETRAGQIACIALAWNDRDAICIPLLCTERNDGYFPEHEEIAVVGLIRKLLTHRNVRVIGQNFLYDLQYLATDWLIKPRLYFDTMLAHHVCWPGGGNPDKPQATSGIQRKGLHALSSFYCDHHVYWKDEGKSWETWMPEEQLWTYNCTDAIKTFECAQELKKLIAHFKLEEQFAFQMEQANELALEMMLNGCAVNGEARVKAAVKLAESMEAYGHYIDGLIPRSVYPRKMKTKKKELPWISSPKQQMEIFYDILGVKPVLHPKTKKPTLGKEAVPILCKREPLVAPVLTKLVERRRVGKAFSTLIQATLDADGRMRCSFNPAGTETFRWNSSKNAFGNGDNLQNVSKGAGEDADEEATPDPMHFQLPNIRSFFVPSPGYELAEFDLAGADAQVVAWEAEDEDLKLAFRKGLKLHLKNTRDIYPHETRNLSDDEIKATDHNGGLYYRLKRMVHGTNYGGTPNGMAPRIGCEVRDIVEFQHKWFDLHPGIKRWHDRTAAGLAKHRSVSNKFGYRVLYFDRIEGLLPQALAWGPQSTVAIACLKGGVAIKKAYKRSHGLRMLLQVHDSLLVEYPISVRDDLLPRIKSTLHSVIVPYADPLQIPWSATTSRKSWADGEKVKGW